jgi:hypothetical protein
MENANSRLLKKISQYKLHYKRKDNSGAADISLRISKNTLYDVT